ncbi:MAG: RNA polymerase sigma factor [Verrucomicrobiales bacterium]
MAAPELLDRLEPLHVDAFGWALHCCRGNYDAAEEALQTAYCRVAEGRAQFGGRAELKTWWFGVVRLVALEQRRRAFWRAEKLRVWFAGGGGLTEQPAVERVETGHIAALLAALAPRQREVHLSSPP